MSAPKLLDLFSCAGGAAMGYHRAGFDVVGVDIDPQPHYPFEFHQGDALEFLAAHGHEFDAIHASPPCQGYTTMSAKYPKARAEWPRLIGAVRDALIALGLPYVIENVAGAKRVMRDPIKLSGGMFGLGVERPRLFESNVFLVAPPHVKPLTVLGIYGKHHDGRRLWTRSDGSILRAAKTLEEGHAAMGIDWMTWPELTEAIPPAYTEWIGSQLAEAVEGARVAVVVPTEPGRYLQGNGNAIIRRAGGGWVAPGSNYAWDDAQVAMLAPFTRIGADS